MARIKLKQQPTYEFVHQTMVRVGDVNYGGHLGNDAFVRLTNDARVALLRELGASEQDLGDGVTAIVMTDLAVNYLAQAFLHQPLTVHSHLSSVTFASFRVHHLVARQEQPLALVETGLAAFDYQAGELGELPQTFLAALERRGIEV